jgi:hypothetical protein
VKKLGSRFVTALACVVAAPVCAVPIHATFDGAVSGSGNSFNNVLDDIPVGTTASFDLSFDDASLVPTAPIIDFDLAPVSGSLRLGSRNYVLDAGRIWTYTYLANTFEIIGYGLQLTGSGPGLSAGSSLFGLFLNIAPDLTLRSVPLAGFRYPFDGGEFYSYAQLEGTFTATRGITSVAEPSGAGLMLSALLILWYSRRTFRRTKRVAA